MKFNETLMDCVRRDLDKNLIPMLLGEPGIGKSSWLQALANVMHTKCFTLACNQLADKADLTGARLVPVTDDTGATKGYKQVFYPHAVIYEAIEYAKENPRETPILFMDELNRTTPDVTSEALSIPTLRSIGSTDLPPNLRVVIAGNDKGNITSLDEASISRFVLYHVTPDVETFLSLDPELNPFIEKVLKMHPETIFCKTSKGLIAAHKDDDDDDDGDTFIEDIIDDGEDMLQITTPRTISATSRWLNSFSNQELLGLLSDTYTVDGQEISMLQEVLEGHLGATPFCTYLIAEIASGIMTASNQASTVTVAKPAVYDEMKACQEKDALDDFVEDMTENDKSGCLVYALYEQVDNANYLKALASNITQLSGSDMRVLMTLASTDQLDKENTHVFLQTSTPIADKLSVVLEM